MIEKTKTSILHWARFAAVIMSGPPALAFLPAICLATFWFGGEHALLAAAAVVPLIYLIVGSFGDITTQLLRARDGVSGIVQRGTFEELTDQVFIRSEEQGLKSALFLFAIEEFNELTERHGQAAADEVIKRSGERLIAALRDRDIVGQVSDAKFGVCLDPVRHLDLELCIQMAGRLQRALEEPISIDGTVIYASATVGFCQHSRAPAKDGASWLEASTIAISDAGRRGPSAIRAFSDKMLREKEHRTALLDEVAEALENGQIMPWFQPQISSDTGEISGFESLARWCHPQKGVLTPSEFLPAIEHAELLERLAEIMMFHSFTALNAWDKANAIVPQVGVNFAGSELNNPRLVEKISWELDRFNLEPNRLAIEVLETVVASAPDDMITRNINALGKLGCRIDLDDFGTGHASIASIRRFGVNRIKIDRSFVMKADRDPEQQRMISAILTLAERLGVETLAEGVENVGEHVILSQLGCDHVQGYGIARPMPFEQTLGWIEAHNAKLQEVPRIANGKRP